METRDYVRISAFIYQNIKLLAPMVAKVKLENVSQIHPKRLKPEGELKNPIWLKNHKIVQSHDFGGLTHDF